MMEILELYFTTLNLLKPFLLSTIFIYFVLICSNWLQSSKKKCVKGKLVLITGGASGLGRALSFRLAQEGCNIVIADVDEKNGAETVEGLRQVEGVTAKAYKVDVSKLEEVERLKQLIETDIGRVDIVINNAGLLFARAICDDDPSHLQRMVDVNLMSHFWVRVQNFLDLVRICWIFFL